MIETLQAQRSLPQLQENIAQWRLRAHLYKPTDPYKGCGICGFGPGANWHNWEELELYSIQLYAWFVGIAFPL